jgi:hypothetical protein
MTCEFVSDRSGLPRAALKLLVAFSALPVMKDVFEKRSH